MELLRYISIKESRKAKYCINYLFRAGVPTFDIGSVLEYECPVWHPGFTKNCLKTLNVYKNAV